MIVNLPWIVSHFGVPRLTVLTSVIARRGLWVLITAPADTAMQQPSPRSPQRSPRLPDGVRS